jgi:ribokinase
MKKLVLGSLNIDRTYRVTHLVKSMETIDAKKYESYCGGKGFNQAVALARAGSEIFFAGIIGNDGDVFLDALHSDAIRTDFIRRSDTPNGHAVIQVDQEGQNCIIIVSGSNDKVTKVYIDEVLSHFSKGDLIVLQNEISCVDYAIEEASRKGLKIAFNPSPLNEAIQTCDMTKVDILLVNEVESKELFGSDDAKSIQRTVKKKYPRTSVVLTKGAAGAWYIGANGEMYYSAALPSAAIDTTAAGDTFTGYFLHEMSKSSDPSEALRIASIASGISITRKGASPSIPYGNEVRAYGKKNIY